MTVKIQEVIYQGEIVIRYLIYFRLHIHILFRNVLIFIYTRYLNDLYTLDLSHHDNLQWDVPCTYGQPPTARESHTAVLHTAENGKHPRLFIYGGMSGCRLGDVYILDVGMFNACVYAKQFYLNYFHKFERKPIKG